MKHVHVATLSRSLKIPALGLILGLVAGGCSSEGSGSVSVNSPSKIREKLEKGAKTTGPGASKVDDDQGVKFRAKSKGG